LKGHAAGMPPQPPSSAKDEAKESRDWGSGQTLAAQSSATSYGIGGSRIQPQPQRSQAIQKERSPTPDFGVDDDEIIDIDSD
jgi:ubiquitin fusion degradation protein 1